MLLLSLTACGFFDPPNVALIVLDTVRADRTSLCGNPRATTPFLQEQAARGSYTCAMKTSGTWTVPSHASFFTGEPLLVHHASMGHDKSKIAFGVRKMREDLPTLAEIFAKDEYQTVLVSANGLVSDETGLARGFALTDTTRKRPQRGQAFVQRVRENLQTIDLTEPTFVVINIVDAHDPWDAIPAGHAFLPAMTAEKPVRLRNRRRRAYLRAPENQQGFRDHYDYALTQADATLEGVIEALEEEHFFDDDWRLVITSDHGEFLGEHGRILHNGSDLYEPVINVPLVYLDNDGNEPELPSPAGALGVFDLVQTGSWPENVSIEAAFLKADEQPNPKDTPCLNVSFGTWDRTGMKTSCSRGQIRKYDLREDPNEEKPTVIGLDQVPGLDAEVDALRALNRTDAPGQHANEALEALGYLDEDGPK